MRYLLAFFFLFLIPLSACAPIPIAVTVYAANPADASLVKSHGGGGCTIDTGRPGAIRKVGNIDIRVDLSPRAPKDGKTQAFARVMVQQNIKNGPLQPVTLNPALMKLEAGGRRLSSTERNVYSNISRNNRGRTDVASFRYSVPAQAKDNVRMVFQRGAIQIGGQTIDFAPIRFKYTPSTQVYIFPCIPA